MLLQELLPLCGLVSSSDRLTNFKRLEEFNFQTGTFKTDTLQALEQGMAQNWFDSRKNKIIRALAEKLPDSLVRWVAPTSIWTEDSKRLAYDDIDKTLKGGGYGLPLDRHQIQIVEIQ